MTFNRIQNEVHAVQEILRSCIFLCLWASSETCLFKFELMNLIKYLLDLSVLNFFDFLKSFHW